MATVHRQQPAMELNEELIKRRSKQFDLGCITLLDLASAGLRRLGSLDDCVSVIKLNLSDNELSDLDGLPVLTALQSLDLSNNRLTTVADLPRLPALEELVLSGNHVGSIDFKALTTQCPRLRKLHVERNPVELKSGLVALIRMAMPSLMTLNGEALAFYDALSQETQEVHPFPAVVESGALASPYKAPSAFQLPAFDAVKFANEASSRLEEMLRDAQRTLDSEAKRVELAFGR